MDERQKKCRVRATAGKRKEETTKQQNKSQLDRKLLIKLVTTSSF